MRTCSFDVWSVMIPVQALLAMERISRSVAAGEALFVPITVALELE